MQTLTVENIRVRANHGCLEEEGRIGADYVVDVILTGDFTNSVKSDALSDTADYVRVNKIVVEQMKIRSKLIESVGGRILKALQQEFTFLDIITVKVTKINPPIHGDVEKVTFTISTDGY